MLRGELGQSLSRSDLEEDPPWVCEQFLHAVGKPNRLTHVTRPVIGTQRFVGRDPLPGDVRDVGDLGGAQGSLLENLSEWGKDRLHHWRVERVGRAEAAARDAARAEFLLQGRYGLEWAGGHTEIR